jgi:hypothetical protein
MVLWDKLVKMCRPPPPRIFSDKLFSDKFKEGGVCHFRLTLLRGRIAKVMFVKGEVLLQLYHV